MISHEKKFIFYAMPHTADVPMTYALAPFCEHVNRATLHNFEIEHKDSNFKNIKSTDLEFCHLNVWEYVEGNGDFDDGVEAWNIPSYQEWMTDTQQVVDYNKNVGSNINLTLMRIDQKEYLRGKKALNSFYRPASGCRERKNETIEQFTERTKDYFRFAFVKNPFDRIVSYALHWNKSDFDSNLIAENIIHNRAFNGQRQTRSPMRQVDLLDVKMDFIGKYENYKSDWAKICEFIGIREKPLIKENGQDDKRVDDHVRFLRNQEDIDKVKEVYKEDFIRYGYLKESDY